ncbi:MAG: hypothetical protein ACTSPM_07005 [Candidatus Heimdallarchaeota archaeon]
MYFSNPTNFAFLIGGIAAIIVSILIFTKDIRAPLNILFASSQFFWGISLLFNALTFVFTSVDQNAVHYFRDISTSSGCVGAFLVFLTAFTMYKGLHYLKKWYFIIPIAIVCIVDVFVGAIFDHVVADDPVVGGIKTTQAPWVMIFIYGIPVVMIILANIYFLLTKREVYEKIVKKRITLFVIGFSLIVLGVLIYALYGIFVWNSRTNI